MRFSEQVHHPVNRPSRGEHNHPHETNIDARFSICLLLFLLVILSRGDSIKAALLFMQPPANGSLVRQLS